MVKAANDAWHKPSRKGSSFSIEESYQFPIIRRMTSLSVPRMPSRAIVLTARIVFSTPSTTMPSPP